jgi:hypothetical protein
MTALDKLAADIRSEHEACVQHARSAVEHAIKAGELLIEAKSQVKHGEWLPWLAENFPASRETARKYVQLAEANYNRSCNLDEAESIRDGLAKVAKQRQPASVPVIRPGKLIYEPIVAREPDPEPDPAIERQQAVDGARNYFRFARDGILAQVELGLTEEQEAALRGDIIALARDFAAVTTPIDWDAEFGDLLEGK